MIHVLGTNRSSPHGSECSTGGASDGRHFSDTQKERYGEHSSTMSVPLRKTSGFFLLGILAALHKAPTAEWSESCDEGKLKLLWHNVCYKVTNGLKYIKYK